MCVCVIKLSCSNTKTKQFLEYWFSGKSQASWTRKCSEFLSPLNFRDLAQCECHWLAPALTLLWSCKERRQGKRVQKSKNILALFPEGLAESSSVLITPGNTWTGAIIGRLPWLLAVMMSTVRNTVCSYSNIPSSGSVFSNHTAEMQKMVSPKGQGPVWAFGHFST